ncbi:MAG: alpha-1,4-glucan--maltose-1-phosphate maltosyltransferase [Candidatus Dormibacteria bacterium]
MPDSRRPAGNGHLPSSVQRVVISELRPQVDCGQRAVKATQAEVVPVSARVFSDGRLALRVQVRWRKRLEAARQPPWNLAETADLAPDHDDWWRGSIRFIDAGPAEYMVEAWEDRFGTWRTDVVRRMAAGIDVAPEISEGWSLLKGVVGQLAEPTRSDVEAAITRAGSTPDEEQLEYLVQESLAVEVARIRPRRGIAASPRVPLWVERPRALFGSWYELFPRSQGSDGVRSGTLRATADRLPDIAAMGFDVAYLTPIHPIGRTGRRGPNNTPSAGPSDPGSPWAIGSQAGGHTAIDPELGTLADFHHLVSRAQDLGLEIAMDYALQCSPDHPWVGEHPNWFAHRPDGSIRPADNPPKRYDDIYPLDFQCAEWRLLWEACYQVLEYWIEQGVQIFRVDNPHTKPVPFWAYVVSRLRREHPEVVLLAEAFTRPAMMRELAKLGFSQSYTYFTWRSSRDELTSYLTELSREMVDYLRPNFFVNTPDILTEELQKGGPPAFRHRLVLAATMAPSYGVYSGFELFEREPLQEGGEEYLDSEKYQFRPRSPAGDDSLVSLMTRLNMIRRQHPALQQFRDLSFHWPDDPALICYSKRSADHRDVILVVVNLDPHSTHASTVHLDLGQLGVPDGSAFEVEDLLSGARFWWQGPHNHVRLDPAIAPAHVFWVPR